MPRHSYATFLSARPWGVTASLALATFLVAGCQVTSGVGSPVPKTSSTTASPAASASTSAPATSPSPAGEYRPADAHGKAQNVPVPVMPELAKENSKAGLEAFIGYWYAAQNYAMETGDLSTWSPLTTNPCMTCKRIEKGIRDSHISGRWPAGGKITIPTVELLWVDGSLQQQGKVQVIQEAVEYFNADGSTGRPSEGATNSAFALFANYSSTGWQVYELGLIN